MEPETRNEKSGTDLTIGSRARHKFYLRPGVITAMDDERVTIEYDHGGGVTTIGTHAAEELEAA